MNERFFSLSKEKQNAILNAGYRVFSQNSYKNSPMSEIAQDAGSVNPYCFIIFITKRSCICFCGTTVPD